MSVSSIISGLSNVDPSKLSSTESSLLGKLEEPQKSIQTATLQLEHMKELNDAISDMLKKLGDMNNTIIGNIR
jgi:hypothetical protein